MFDLILRGGTVYDGRGGAPYVADMGVRGDRVVCVGDLSRAQADSTTPSTDLFSAVYGRDVWLTGSSASDRPGARAGCRCAASGRYQRAARSPQRRFRVLQAAGALS